MIDGRRVVHLVLVIASIAVPATARQIPPPPLRTPAPPQTAATDDQVKQLRVLADKGDAQAQNDLGVAYAAGVGVMQDDEVAFWWYSKAADQGLPSAQFLVGGAYANGRGVPKDERRAADWFRKVAEKGYALAQRRLGDIYSDAGVMQDAAQAVVWYRMAAEQGEPAAQLSLALLIYGGVGAPKDVVAAYKWFNISAALASADSRQMHIDSRDAVAKQMTPGQVADAQKQSREWMDAFSRRMSGPPTTPPPAPLRVGGDIQEPARTKYVAPIYSALAQAARVEGAVVIEATIGPDGKVQDVKVLRSTPLLDAAALDAVRQWEFSPTRVNDVPVTVVMSVTVVFSLK